MRFSPKLALAGGAAGLALAGVIYGGTAFAQAASSSPKPTAAAAANYQAFVQHLASRLNLSQSQVDSAVKGAETDVVADAVKAGKITQAQADKIDQRIQTGAGGFPGLRGGSRPGIGQERTTALTAAAGVLNLQVSDLMNQLRGGKTLQDIATAQKIDFSKVQAAITSAVKSDLDKAVASGKLTSQQEQKILAGVASGKFGGPHSPPPRRKQ